MDSLVYFLSTRQINAHILHFPRIIVDSPPRSKSYRAHPPCLGTPPYVLHENLALTHFYDYLDRHVGGVQRSQSYCTIYLNFILKKNKHASFYLYWFIELFQYKYRGSHSFRICKIMLIICEYFLTDWHLHISNTKELTLSKKWKMLAEELRTIHKNVHFKKKKKNTCVTCPII